MDLKKGMLLKKIRNHSQPLKLQQTTHNNFAEICIAEVVARAVRNSEVKHIWLRYSR